MHTLLQSLKFDVVEILQLVRHLLKFVDDILLLQDYLASLVRLCISENSLDNILHLVLVVGEVKAEVKQLVSDFLLEHVEGVGLEVLDFNNLLLHNH